MFTEETIKYVFDRCPTCHIGFLLPSTLLQKQKDLNGLIHCPQGHGYSYRANVAEELRRQVAYERERGDRLNASCTEKDRLIAALRRRHHSFQKLKGEKMIQLNLLYVTIYLIAGFLYSIWNEHQMDEPAPDSTHMHVVVFLTTLLGWPMHASLWIRYFCFNRES